MARSFSLSIVLHGLILLILYSIYIEIRTPLKEFTELSIGHIGSIPLINLTEKSMTGLDRPSGAKPPLLNQVIGEPINIGKYEAPTVETINLLRRSLSSFSITPLSEKKSIVQGEIEDVVGARGGGEMTEPYLIEGAAAQRRIITKVIPEYPPNYQKEAIITLSFQILPSGLVTGIAIERKGDPTLEQIAVDAFKQWIFEPLPETTENQFGRITFIFKVR
ncbi:MAG: energy transducer TonB [candidate division WOR-3 bacterium]